MKISRHNNNTDTTLGQIQEPVHGNMDIHNDTKQKTCSEIFGTSVRSKEIWCTGMYERYYTVHVHDERVGCLTFPAGELVLCGIWTLKNIGAETLSGTFAGFANETCSLKRK